jgi:alpha-aminoadipate/glutamate carrier protein LysW
MTTQNPQFATIPPIANATTPGVAVNQSVLPVANCTECDARIQANVALPGEILDCPDCGAELEVRSVTPLVLALAPTVEEDWGE